MLHAFNSRTLEAEVGSQPGLQEFIPGQSGYIERPCHKKTKQNKTNPKTIVIINQN